MSRSVVISNGSPTWASPYKERTWPQSKVDCPVHNQEDRFYESLQEESLYEIEKSPIEIQQELTADEIDCDLSSTIKQETKQTVQRKLKGLAFTEMDSIFLANPNGPFGFEGGGKSRYFC